MAASLKDQLQAIFGNDSVGEEIDSFGVPANGAQHGGYFKGGITDAFRQYAAEFANKDFYDPREIAVTLLEENFPKLIKLMYRARPNLPGRRARARVVIPQLKSGTFDEAKHYSEQPIRLRTLFWIPEVIQSPNGIGPNASRLIDGEEVYYKRYAKEGSDIKLIFTTIRPGGLRVAVTSFVDVAENLGKYCGLPLLWPPKK